MSAKTAKKSTKNIRARNWITIFAYVLADEEHNFAAALEEFALKKAASNEVFITLIQKIFDQKRRENHFIEVHFILIILLSLANMHH